MRVDILGARGSTPAPGKEFSRYGGHTSCVAITPAGQGPRLVLDAGTGIRRLSRLLGGAPFRGSVLLGHLHWDHTQGLPFFGAGDNPEAVVRLYAPAQPDEDDMQAVLARAMSPPHFPITPAQLRGEWTFNGLGPGQHELEGLDVLALEIPHKGGRAFGYRITDGRASLAYLSDHCPTSLGPGPEGLGEYHPAALQLARDVDILFHDSQYTDEELPARAHFGHSCPGYALGLARAAGAKQLLLYHHDPQRTDEEVDMIQARYQGTGVAVAAAAEGAVIDVGG